MKKIYLALVSIVLIIICDTGSARAAKGDKPTLESKQLYFIENRGQVNDQDNKPRPDIQFTLNAAAGLSVFIGKGFIHYQFNHADSITTAESEKQLARANRSRGKSHDTKTQSVTYQMYRMDVELAGANADAEPVTEDEQDYYETWYTGQAGENGALVHVFNRIRYKNVYPGIDWVLYIDKGRLEHEFIVHENGNPDDIKIKYTGWSDLKLNTDGSLAASTPLGVITEKSPRSFKADGSLVKSNFRLNGNILTYQIESHNGALTLDPGLDWGTYYGGYGGDYAAAVTTDKQGNAFITGYTTSTSNIATTGAFKTTYTASGGRYNAFLAKFSGSGALLWATYYGSEGFDEGTGLACDRQGNIYMSGYTFSTTGIATPGAYQTTVSLGTSNFLAKFSSTGARIWGTYYGLNTESDTYVATDDSEHVYLSGSTTSTTGIATAGAHKTIIGAGGENAFIVKFDSAGHRLWGTYYGGDGSDITYAMCSNASGKVCITGTTTSTTGISTTGSYQPNLAQPSEYGGAGDAFIAQFNAAGALEWGTYFGSSSTYRLGTGVASDAGGNVYVGVTIYGYNLTLMAVKFNSSGAEQWNQPYAACYGGDSWILGAAVDVSGNFYTSGYTTCSTDIALPNGYQPTIVPNSGWYFFIAEYTPDGTQVYGTYYGSGEATEIEGGMAIDDSSNIYIVGSTGDTTGISTPGAYQTQNEGGGGVNIGIDACLIKFTLCGPVAVSGDSSVCMGTTTTLSNAALGGTWNSSNTAIATINSGGVVTPVAAGADTIIYNVTNSCGTQSDTFIIKVLAAPAASINTGGPSSFCQGGSVTLKADSSSSYLWSNNATTQSVVINQAGSYTLTTGAANGCSATSAAVEVTVNPLPVASITAGGPTTFCTGDSVALTAAIATKYLWNIGDTTRSIKAFLAGSYIVTVTNSYGCTATASTSISVKQLSASEISQDICPGQNYKGHSTSGSFTDTLFNESSNGCDSVILVHLTVLPVVTSTIQQIICQGESYAGYTNQGTHIDTFHFAASNGCDSIRTLMLTVLPAANANIAQSICSNESYLAHDTSGIYVDTLQNASLNGCDSIIHLNLTVLPLASSVVQQTICANTQYEGHDTTGTYIDTLPNAATNGCDSVINLSLTVLPVNVYTFGQSVCAGQSYLGHNATGTYIDTLRNASENGCDSIISLNLIVLAAPTSSLGDTICQGNVFAFMGQNLTHGGIYTDTVQTGNGCDSLVVLSLHVDSLPAPFVARNLDTLQTQNFASYQWLLNGTPIDTATAQSLIVGQNGDFSVVVANADGCTDTSAALNVTNVGFSNIITAYNVKLYPNPNNGNFILEFADNEEREIEITDAIGKIVVESMKISKQKYFSFNALAEGMYAVQIRGGAGLEFLKFSIAR